MIVIKQPLFEIGRALRLKLLFLVLISVALLALDQHFAFLRKARYSLDYVVAPIRYWVAQPERLGQWLGEELSSHQSLIHKNRSLRKENLLLQVRMLKYDALQAENEYLKKLLNATTHLHIQVKIVQLLAVDLAPYTQRVLINEGKRSGAYIGQPVLDANGLLGQIIETGPYSAQVLLISDPGSAVPVIDIRSGLRLLAVGTGQSDTLKLRSAPNSANIRIGDLLVTSGLGRRFLPDYPVCHIDAIQRTPGKPFADVSCKPAAALGRYRQVLLLWTTTTHQKPASGNPSRLSTP